MKKTSLFAVALSLAVGVFTSPASANTSFTDVKKDFWAHDMITELSNEGIVDGTEDGLFHSNTDIRRDTTAIWLAKALKLDTANVTNPNFTDVDSNDPAYPYIAAVVEEGIFSGRDGEFAPGESLTRAQMAKVLVESFDLVGKYEEGFNDIKNTFWAVDYISRLAESEVTTGYKEDQTFRPNNATTRAQLAVFLHRALNPELTDWSAYKEKELPDITADEARAMSLEEFKELYPSYTIGYRAGGTIYEESLNEEYHDLIQRRPKFGQSPKDFYEFTKIGIFGSGGLSLEYPNFEYIHVDGIAYSQHPRFVDANVQIPSIYEIEDPKTVFPRSPSKPGQKLVDIYFREAGYGIYTSDTPSFGFTKQIRKTVDGSATVDGQTIFGEFGIVYQDNGQYIFLVNGHKLIVAPNRKEALLNGEAVQLKTTPYMDKEAKGTLMVPLLEFAELLDLETKVWSKILRVELSNYPNE